MEASLRGNVEKAFEKLVSIGKDTPDGRPVQPAGSGTVVSLPKVGGLHHRYERLAA